MKSRATFRPWVLLDDIEREPARRERRFDQTWRGNGAVGLDTGGMKAHYRT
jgi:hypothetical protein